MTCQKLEGNKSPIPSILKTLTDALWSNEAHKCEGVFRIAADVSVVNTLRAAIEESPDFSAEIRAADQVADILKQWLRDMSIPLIPSSVYELCIETANKPPAECVDMMRKVLPPEHLAVLDHIMVFLQNLCDYSTVTKMEASNFSIVITPNIIKRSSRRSKADAQEY
eukprot:TRINITY_DN2120_c0_g1_i1.p1 TRINITY_DN2120_c0_g1~~TRINITY_DN2120_c0_g1_i1.p1  ORF type:complete len:167 (+),score=10.71 TRINITY_DN2120_c0_g1_i1:467-967(+)